MDQKHLRELIIQKGQKTSFLEPLHEEESLDTHYGRGGERLHRPLAKSRSDSRLADRWNAASKPNLARRTSVIPGCTTAAEDQLHEDLLQEQLKCLRERHKRASICNSNNNIPTTTTTAASKGSSSATPIGSCDRLYTSCKILCTDENGNLRPLAGDNTDSATSRDKKPSSLYAEEDSVEDSVLDTSSRSIETVFEESDPVASSSNVNKIKDLLEKLDVKRAIREKDIDALKCRYSVKDLNGYVPKDANMSSYKGTASIAQFVSWFKREMAMLRVLDQCIAGRLLTLHNDILCRRLSRYLNNYQNMLDEAEDIEQSREIMLGYNWCDIIPESHDRSLVSRGVTRYNITHRRYSV